MAFFEAIALYEGFQVRYDNIALLSQGNAKELESRLIAKHGRTLVNVQENTAPTD